MFGMNNASERNKTEAKSLYLEQQQQKNVIKQMISFRF